MITACLVIYHEEKKIKDCLEQLNGIVDEILIVHDGECYDQSIQIAKQYADKIFIREHIGIAEPHRAFLYQQAKGDFILILDADECFSWQLKNFLKNKQFNFDALRVPWWEENNDTIIKRNFYKLIFFRKEKMHFIGFPQAEAFTSGSIKTMENCPLINKPGFSNYSMKSWQKQKKWIKVHAHYYVKELSAIPSFQFDSFFNAWKKKHAFRIRWPFLFFSCKAAFIFSKNLFSFSKNYRHNFSLAIIACYYYLLLGCSVTILKLRRFFRKDRPENYNKQSKNKTNK